MSRPGIVLTALAATLFLFAPSLAQSVDTSPKGLGADDAPVTIIEYLSLSCPHCARFHKEHLPWLRETYIDTGRVRLEFRDFPLNAPALWGAMLCHCAGPEKYFAFLDLLLARQSRWAFVDKPQAALKKLAKQAGMSGDAFDACMADEELQLAVIKARSDAMEAYDIGSTPSFVIGGEVFSGVLTKEHLTELIEAAGN
jgi:protein-disulfide isomerase